MVHSRDHACARIEQCFLRFAAIRFQRGTQAPGQGNIADPMSRLLRKEVKPNKHQQSAEEYVRFVAVNATPTALTTRKIEEASVVDEELV